MTPPRNTRTATRTIINHKPKPAKYLTFHRKFVMGLDNAYPAGNSANKEEARPHVKADDDITSLSEGLVNVSIGSKPKPDDPPEAIKSVADLISCNKYKNIVVLTGAGISCNAGIPGENHCCVGSW